MNKNIKLNSVDTIDLESLITTKLLVQANSGGGKSWLLRRLLERSHGKVQQIVIDLEGEFSTLREKYDYILASEDGDTPVEPRSAAVLARKILELNVSAIVDLYELKHHERIRFVKFFLEAMINAPKKLWHPVLVVIDEAHIFCPEKGQAESADAVIDLATRGRKRGYCAVLATQRLSKLHKDAAAECNNKLIGRTGLDIDRKRASEELGFTSKDQNLALRDLEAGEFFAFGPSISREVKKIKIGDVKTTHPKAGARFKVKVAPPTDKIKSILKKLADLPEAARKEANTISELKADVINLRRHKCPTVQITDNRKDIEVAVNRALKDQEKTFAKIEQAYKKQHDSLSRVLVKALKDFKEISDLKNFPIYIYDAPKIPDKIKSGQIIKRRNPIELETLREGTSVQYSDDEEKTLKGGELRMLKVLTSRYPMAFTKSQLATFSAMSARGGSYSTYLSTLRTRGLIEEKGDLITASEKGLDYIGEVPNPPQTTEEVIEMWRSNLKGGARRMFDILIEQSPHDMTKEELGEQSEVVHTGGSFSTYLSMLRRNGLIEENQGHIKISENLFI